MGQEWEEVHFPTLMEGYNRRFIDGGGGGLNFRLLVRRFRWGGAKTEGSGGFCPSAGTSLEAQTPNSLEVSHLSHLHRHGLSLLRFRRKINRNYFS